MGSAPSPPPPPDASVVSAAQGAANVNTAKAESFFKNANVDSPEGKVEWEWAKDSSGNYITETINFRHVDTGALLGTEELRKPLKKVTMTPGRQAIFDTEQDVKLKINQWALQQVNLIKNQQLNPLTTDNLPAFPVAPSSPQLDQAPLTPGSLVEQIGGGDVAAHLDGVKIEIKGRLQPDIDRARQREVVRLGQMGLEPGMEAYDNAMEIVTRQENDLYLEAELKARGDHTRSVQTEAMIGDFANKTQEAKFRQQKVVVDHKNAISVQLYQIAADIAQFMIALRQQSLQERISVRGHNVNEITSLIHGGHVQVPQFANWKGSNIAPPPIADATYRSYAAELDIWKTEVAQSNQMMGGILGFAGNMAGMMLSDRRVKRDIVKITDDPRGFGWYSYRYWWEVDGVEHIGVMAQELLEHIPDAVVTLPNGLLAVNYGRVLH